METGSRYEANRLRVVRQVRFDPKSRDALDLVLFVNGIPTATVELKNRWTGQTVDEAIAQYRIDRDPRTCCSPAARLCISRSMPSSRT
jgi:type I restriction enzyme R subunit